MSEIRLVLFLFKGKLPGAQGPDGFGFWDADERYLDNRQGVPPPRGLQDAG